MAVLLTVGLCAAFAGFAWRARAWGFLAAAAAAWLTAGAVSLWVLARLGITADWALPAYGLQIANLTLLQYGLHIYLGLGGLCFLAGRVRRNPQSATAWRIDKAESDFLSLLALGGAVQLAAWLTLALLLWWQYPQGGTGVLSFRLVQLYLMNPAAWWVGQGLLMLVFWLHRRVLCGQSCAYFSLPQLQGGFLLALFWQFSRISGLDVWLFWKVAA
ncbi:hypothetical protein [Conchiformibius kuhniae]|uniref:Uncharacterized protein n=1 Tax=Conchiformibius kuhniae TaxID=211502 RepID=A0A8T9MUS2_9NEIS|nr:hypothetical protein [Conchiformibius kuhniae]UOP05407.1 hypothetical protein LVJ77_04305 [Conchiformibius kuhniae]